MKPRQKARKLCLYFLLIPVILLAGFLLYTQSYYHADAAALEALASDDTVTVTRTDWGWMLDGPSRDNVLVFYPGGKVEETAYAPLLRQLAGQGVDVCLVKMPFRLAVFGIDKMDHIPEAGAYANRYIGGHSLGGAMAAYYAAGHSDGLSGLILLAAYPTKDLPEDLPVLYICGSRDGVLNQKKASFGKSYIHGGFREVVIEGGNHAQFGSYGNQKGDGTAEITPRDQWEAAAEAVMEMIRSRSDSFHHTTNQAGGSLFPDARALPG